MTYTLEQGIERYLAATRFVEATPDLATYFANHPELQHLLQLGERPKSLAQRVEAEHGASLKEVITGVYHGQKRTLKETADCLGVNVKTIRAWMKRLGIPIRTTSQVTTLMRRVERKNKRSCEELVQDLYVDQQLSIPQVAEALDVNAKTVRRWILQFGYETRGYAQQRLARYGGERPEAAQLEHWYIAEKRSSQWIADQCGVTKNAICNWLDQEGFDRRGAKQAKLALTKGRHPSPEELEQMYGKQQLSGAQIAARCNVSDTTVRLWLRAAGIPIRSAREAKKVRGRDNDPGREQLRIWYIIEGTSQREIGRRCMVSYDTARRWMKGYGLVAERQHLHNGGNLELGVKAYLAYCETTANPMTLQQFLEQAEVT